MAELAGVFAASHAPLIARDWDRLQPSTQEKLTLGLEEVGRRIDAANLDVLIVISPDHWVNFSLTNLPTVCIGVGDAHDPPPEPFMKAFPYADRLVGHPALAQHLLAAAIRDGFEPSISYRLTLDHGFCIPLWKAKLERLPAILPIVVNDLEPPCLSARRCLQWGALLRRAVDSFPERLRIGVLATGGLSHSIGEPTMGRVDEDFDHRFVQWLQQYSADELADRVEPALERTGNGAQEVRNWLIAHGTGFGAFDLIRYDPLQEVYVGCAFASWKPRNPQ